MTDKCPSCGVELINHIGLHGTCEKLQIAINLLKEIKEGGYFDILGYYDKNGERIQKDIDELFKEVV